jgi:disulfide bond formation protein DsbB
MFSPELFSFSVSILTLVGQVVTVVLALLLMRDYRSRSRSAITTWIHKYGLVLAFLVALGAVVGSFIYSDVIGYPPCTLCWYQRAFMMPLVVLLGIAAWKRDRSMVPYALSLAAIGGLIALNHVWLQSSGTSLIPCPAPGPGVVSCDQRFVYEFGYLTIPVMSLTGFAFIGALLAHAQVRSK